MRTDLAATQLETDKRRDANERAQGLTESARGEYINVLRATVRRYGKNIRQLGNLAGIEVHCDLPHLENDDLVLAQAGLTAGFVFDQKGVVGLNDGEASGGQQVMKSLILLIGLMMEEDQPGGFVFIDGPFAHLDIFNIDRAAGFLKSTRAQYLITTPITHNVNIFDPTDLTLTLDPIGRRTGLRIALCGDREPPPAHPRQFRSAHQPRHPVVTRRHTLRPQLRVHPGRAVSAIRMVWTARICSVSTRLASARTEGGRCAHA